MSARLLDLGGVLLLGNTALLGLACIALLACRQPVLRQRIAELGVAAAIAWSACAVVPLPRHALADRVAAWVGVPAELTATASLPHTRLTAAIDPSADAPSDALPALAAADRSALHAGAAADAMRRPSDSAEPDPSAPPPALSPVAPAARRPLDPWRIAWAIWAVAGVSAAGLLLIGRLRLTVLLRGTTAAPPWITRMIAHAGRSRGRPIRIRIAHARCRPFCCGLRRPTIVLPEAVCREEIAAALAPIVRHELAHALRGDARGQALFALALPLFALHPLYWLLRKSARFAAEVIADESAAAEDRPSYARCLIQLAEEDARFERAPLAGVGMFGSRPEFTRRIEMLMTRRAPLSTRCSLRSRAGLCCSTLLVLTGAVAMLGAGPAHAQDAAALQQSQREQIAELQARNQDLRNQNLALQQRLAALELAVSGRVVDGSGRAVPDASVSVGQPEVLTPPTNNSGQPDARTLSTLRALGYVAAAAPTDTPTSVVVQPGDTLPSLAKQHLGSADAESRLRELNPHVDPTRLRVGQVLHLLPPPDAGEPQAPQYDPRRSRDDSSQDVLALAQALIEKRGQCAIAEAEALDETLASEATIRVQRARQESLQRHLELLLQFAHARLEAIEAELRYRQAVLDRSRMLAEQGFVPQSDLLRAEAARAETVASMRILQDAMR